MIESEVWHYDGRNANRWRPRLVGDAASFRLIGEGWESGPWAWADVRALDNAGRDAVFGHAAEPGWRIGFADGLIPEEIKPLLPKRARYGGFIDRIGLGKASVVLSLVAAAALFVGLKAPGWLAPLMPQSWEDRQGDAMVGDAHPDCPVAAHRRGHRFQLAHDQCEGPGPEGPRQPKDIRRERLGDFRQVG